MAWTSIMRHDRNSLSLTHDLRRDWKRWSATERLGAVATMLMALVLLVDAIVLTASAARRRRITALVAG